MVNISSSGPDPGQLKRSKVIALILALIMTIYMPTEFLDYIAESWGLLTGVLLGFMPTIILLVLTKDMKDDQKAIKGLIFIIAGILGMISATQLASAYASGWPKDIADWLEFGGAILFVIGIILMIGSMSMAGDGAGSGKTGGKNKGDKSNKTTTEPEAEAGPEAEEGKAPKELDDKLEQLDQLVAEFYYEIDLMRQFAIQLLEDRHNHPEIEQPESLEHYLKSSDKIFKKGTEEGHEGVFQALHKSLKDFMKSSAHSERTIGQGKKFTDLIARFQKAVHVATLNAAVVAKNYEKGVEKPTATSTHKNSRLRAI